MCMKANFHKKRWAPGLALKKRPKVIRKWPIVDPRRGKIGSVQGPFNLSLNGAAPIQALENITDVPDHSTFLVSKRRWLQWLTWVIDSAAIRFVNVNSYKFFVLCKVILSKGRKEKKQKNSVSSKSDKKPHFHPLFVKANYHNTVLCFRWAILKSSLVVWSRHRTLNFAIPSCYVVSFSEGKTFLSYSTAFW